MAVDAVFNNGSFLSGAASASTYSNNGGVSVSSFYNTDALDKKYHYNDAKESYEIAYNGKNSAIDSNIKNIQTYLEKGEEDKVLDAYNKLLDQMSKQERFSQLSKDGDDTQLRAIARQEIESVIGCDLASYIEENASDEANTTYKKILFWGNADSTTKGDLLKEMCDLDVEEPHANVVVDVLAAIASPFAAIGNFLTGNTKQ